MVLRTDDRLPRDQSTTGQFRSFGSPSHLQAISDGYGYEVKDDLAALFTERTRGALRDHDVVARLGSNEFALFIPGVDSGGLRRIVARIFAELEAPFSVADKSFRLRAWAGGVTMTAPLGGRRADARRRLRAPVREAICCSGGLFIYDERGANSCCRAGPD